MSIPELIAQWRERKTTGFGLRRGLVGYGRWEVPISERAVAEALAGNALPPLQLSADKDGKTCLSLFSSTDSFDLYRRTNGSAAEQHFVTLDGTAVFGAPLDGVDRASGSIHCRHTTSSTRGSISGACANASMRSRSRRPWPACATAPRRAAHWPRCATIRPTSSPSCGMRADRAC
jgi:hypothetical protein